MAVCAVGPEAGVLSTDVALRALHGGVLSGERERRVVVIERCALPLRGGVARLARGREASGLVGRICRPVVLRHVAAGAVGSEARILAANVTLRALHRGVLSGQWKSGGAVIELCSLPLGGRMANLTIGWEAAALMVGVRRAVILPRMAIVATGGQASILSACVALPALQIAVPPGERELREPVVVELHSHPAVGYVTESAVAREARRLMVGVSCRGELLLMTGCALGVQSLKRSCPVAAETVEPRVRAGKGEARERVVETRAPPRVCCVARFAGGGNVQCLVIQGAGLAVVAHVA